MPSDIVRTRRLELVSLGADCLSALLEDDATRAAEIAGVDAPEGWPGERDARWVNIRLGELRADAAIEPWLLRAMRIHGERTMVGHIGFHGYPDASGVAELGYTVFEPYRRRGHATEAIRGLMHWASETHGVRRFRLSIAPHNAPSLALARKLDFVQTGSHIDEEDGLELIFEHGV